MTCVELQESLAEVEDATTADQKTHLRNCPACAGLVRELNLIISAAVQLQDADEPSPRVWNSIESALRQEGLIRPQQKPSPFVPSFMAQWGPAKWLMPAAAAMLLLAAGIFVRQRLQPDLQQHASLSIPYSDQGDLNDDDLLQEVSLNSPTMKTQYEENLKNVNESIHDAQALVQESPNDEDARRSLLDAYQQKSMLFEMAMDRTLP
jgi:hypothetical protein